MSTDRHLRDVHRTRPVVLFVLLALATTAWGQATTEVPGELLTLEQALVLALRNNRQVQNAALEVDKAAARVAAMRTRRLPVFKVTVTGLYLLMPIEVEFKQGDFGTFPSTGPIPAEDTTIRTPPGFQSSVSASVAQPLSQLYRIGLNIQQQAVNQHITREQLQSQRQTTVYDVKRAYYSILQTRSALEAAAAALATYRELDRLVERYVAQQTALGADSLEVKTRLARTEYEVLTLRNALAAQHEQLNELLGRDIRTAFRVSPVPDATPFEADLAAAQAQALKQRPEVQIAQLKVAQATNDLRIKHAEYIPDLNVVFSYLSPVTSEVLPQHITYVGLEFSWDIYDWGRKQAEITERRKTLEQARNDFRHAEPQILLEVNARFRTLQEQRVLLRVNQLEQETAQEKLRVTTQKYSQQAVLLQDVLQAQATVAEATHQYQKALLTFWTARAEFEKALGDTYEE